MINEAELGPCNRGCPYQPKRRKLGHNENKGKLYASCIIDSRESGTVQHELGLFRFKLSYR